LNLSDLYRCDGRLGLARDRNGRTGQPVGEQLLGVVFSDGCGLRDRRDPNFGTGEQGDRGDRDNGYNSGQSSRWAENKREEIERSARAPLALARINPLRIKRTTTNFSSHSIFAHGDSQGLRLIIPTSSYYRIFDFFRSFSKSRAVAPSTLIPYPHTRIFCPMITSSHQNSPISKNP
jgi:hypothetical protein